MLLERVVAIADATIAAPRLDHNIIVRQVGYFGYGAKRSYLAIVRIDIGCVGQAKVARPVHHKATVLRRWRLGYLMLPHL